ncbi:MAG: CRISPR-associated endonuclease Cas3'', partial [Endomicrobium sp.]|nr:CRISPR-associated endonuclease Cas3'' [Endomicrobium sp.]
MKILSSYRSKVLSHPDKLLSEHLANVWDIISNEIKLKNIDNKTEIKDILKIAAVCHDLGKATYFFQQYLENKHGSQKTHHSLLSALIAFYLAKQLKLTDVLIPFYLIRSHHSNLKNISNGDTGSPDKNIILEQIDALNKEDIISIIKCVFGIDFNFDVFKEYINTGRIFKDIYLASKNIDSKLEKFFFIEFLFSLIIYADKADAGIDNKSFYEIKEKIKNFNSPDAVNTYIAKNIKTQKNISKQKMDNIRDSIYKDAMDYAHNVDLDKKIF